MDDLFVQNPFLDAPWASHQYFGPIVWVVALHIVGLTLVCAKLCINASTIEEEPDTATLCTGDADKSPVEAKKVYPLRRGSEDDVDILVANVNHEMIDIVHAAMKGVDAPHIAPIKSVDAPLQTATSAPIAGESVVDDDDNEDETEASKEATRLASGRAPDVCGICLAPTLGYKRLPDSPPEIALDCGNVLHRDCLLRMINHAVGRGARHVLCPDQDCRDEISRGSIISWFGNRGEKAVAAMTSNRPLPSDEERAAALALSRDRTLFPRAKDVNVCPACGIVVERSSGCAHMECEFCGTAFCIRCGRPQDDCQSDGEDEVDDDEGDSLPDEDNDNDDNDNDNDNDGDHEVHEDDSDASVKDEE